MMPMPLFGPRGGKDHMRGTSFNSYRSSHRRNTGSDNSFEENVPQQCLTAQKKVDAK